MKKAGLCLGTLAWALAGSGCAVSTGETEPDEQVGETSEEIRNFHLPGTGFGNTAQQGSPSCVDNCQAARAACEAANGANGTSEPMEPCDVNYANCIWACPLIFIPQ